MKALEEARSVINVDHADEDHAKLSAMAQSADSAAASLVAMSQGISSTGGQQQGQVSAPMPQSQVASFGAPMQGVSQPPQAQMKGLAPPVQEQSTPGSLGSLLGDLRSLQ